ncbi:MAG: polysaccharide export protein [Verrucomicrobia bacterium]|nr:polysaccharide export protein [Verrucomicrobiota bacterium]
MLRHVFALSVVLLLGGALPLIAADAPAKDAAPAPKPGSLPSTPGQEPSRLYVIKPNDVVIVKVYQEEDLTTQARVARDGTITMYLLGTVNIGSNSVEQATTLIHDLLAKDYLVNPQVSLNIVEYAKRRFTVMGQVNRPGTYEMPSDDTMNLLQAIATAGGYTRIGNPKKIAVQRVVDGKQKIIELNADAMAKDKNSKPFDVLPDDTITVGEKWL